MSSTDNQNVPDNNGWTPIHWATINGHIEIHTRIAGHSTASTIAASELSFTDGIFHVEFSKLVQIMENLCVKGTIFF